MTWIRWLALFLVLALVAGLLLHALDMRRAYQRIASGSELLRGAFGDIEYAQGGSGVAVLVIHGSGGGFDQGVLLAETLLDARFHWIAPSRFGYLRSSAPADASFAQQADAFADLLDRLGHQRVAVLALSHGGPSALLFAVRHPQRVSSLTLISAGVAASTDTAQSGAQEKGSALVSLWRYDIGYWAVSRFMRSRLMRLMGASDDVVAGLTSDQRALLHRLVDEMNPASPRHAGVVLDHYASLPGDLISDISAPALIVHARDDALQLFHNAEFAAAHIPQAEMMVFEHGGHLLLAVEQPRLREAVQAFILAHE